MALWKGDNGKDFDDGLAFKPGEEGFTRDLAAEHFGNGGFNYAGTPNWHLRIEAEHREAEEARLAAIEEAAA